MKMRAPLIVGAALVASIAVAKADDHLVTAQEHGLTLDSHAFTTNKAGHSGDLAPGQGSPFRGEEQKTPSTDTDAANDHAKVKQR